MQSIIAIQGIQGSFHHQVALNYFPSDIQISECLTFDALADALVSGRATQAVMAIENSIAGSIIPNYALLDRHNLQIIGESYLNIEHNLMGLKRQSIADLKEVHSHPMALLQCKDFFKAHPHIRLVEAEDTADESVAALATASTDAAAVIVVTPKNAAGGAATYSVNATNATDAHVRFVFNS